MSYNHDPSGPGQTFTEGDVLALQAIQKKVNLYKVQFPILPVDLAPQVAIDPNVIRSSKGKGKMKALSGENIMYFDKFDPFKKKNADKIINFSSARGDKIAFNELALPGLTGRDSFSFISTNSRKDLKAISRQGYDVVYYEKGVSLSRWEWNCKNWGSQQEGGLFGKIDRGLELTVMILRFIFIALTN